MNIIPLFLLAASFLVAPTIGSTCDIVPIREWSNFPLNRQVDLPQPTGLVVVTHTDTSECFTDAECQRVATNIRNLHLNQGLADIGLSFLVGGNGKIYEGAGWKVGGHTLGYNNRSISLSFMGNFVEKLPTPAALEAAEYFLGCYLNTRFLGCEYKVVGHEQLRPIDSPGAALQAYIQSWPHWTSDISRL